MTKKGWITIGAVGTGVTAFAVGVAVPIAVRNHETAWTVNLQNKSGSRYFITQLDPQQNKAKLTGQFIFDVNSKNTKAIKAIAAYLGTEVAQVQAAISADNQELNGLDKLAYDLTENLDNNNLKTSKEVTINSGLAIESNGGSITAAPSTITKDELATILIGENADKKVVTAMIYDKVTNSIRPVTINDIQTAFDNAKNYK